MRDIVIFAGSSNKPLVERICHNLSLPQGKVLLKKFANGETSVQLETSVREKDVFILQSGAGEVNDYLVELLLMISACKMASAKRINVIMPLFFYSRQMDMPAVKAGEIIRTSQGTAGSWIAQNGMLIANLLTSAGANHIITMDLHDSQYQGFLIYLLITYTQSSLYNIIFPTSYQSIEMPSLFLPMQVVQSVRQQSQILCLCLSL